MTPAGSFEPTKGFMKSHITTDDGRKTKSSHNPNDKIAQEMINQVETTILREFEEEILGLESVEKADDYDISSFPLKDAYELYYVGVGLDPLTTKCEMMFLIVIDADMVQKSHLEDYCLRHGFKWKSD